jgi:hypothetical protein
MWTLGVSGLMKSQDVLLLFKFASLHAQEEKRFGKWSLNRIRPKVRQLEALHVACKKAPTTKQLRGLFRGRASDHS